MSFWTNPIVAAKKAVEAPITVITAKAVSEYSIKGEHRMIKNTPAVTIVAAWIRADTGVGPSMASGNHICKPNCADLPKTPQKNNNEMIVNILI
jgi:hypothetical protein